MIKLTTTLAICENHHEGVGRKVSVSAKKDWITVDIFDTDGKSFTSLFLSNEEADALSDMLAKASYLRSDN